MTELDRAIAVLEEAANELRNARSVLPDIQPLHAIADHAAVIMTIPRSARRHVAVSLEPRPVAGLSLVLRECSANQAKNSANPHASHAMVFHLSSLPDLADAIAEACRRVAEQYRAGIEDPDDAA